MRIKDFAKIATLFAIATLLIFSNATATHATTRQKPKTSKTTKTKPKPNGKTQSKPTAKPRSQTAVRTEQQRTQQEIKKTRQAIDNNTRATRQSLDRLGNLNAQMARQQTTINGLQTRLDSINGSIAATSDSITIHEQNVQKLRTELKTVLRQMRRHRQTANPMAFIFSAPDFNTAMRRYQYLGDLRAWQGNAIKRLQREIDELSNKRATLKALSDKHANTLQSLNVAKQLIASQQAESEQLVASLKAQGSSLQKVLAQKQQRLQQLNLELDRIIQAEADAERRRQEQLRRQQPSTPTNKPKPHSQNQPQEGGYADESRSLSGPFAQNQGKLLFPVAGRYTITSTFGHNTRDGLSINNSGIDITVAPGTQARAVFDGTVSSVFSMPTYHWVVIIRHGAYLTVYAGLGNVTVTQGQKVKTGQALGTIFTDTADAQHTELHFEVRRERQKLNPLQWVR